MKMIIDIPEEDYILAKKEDFSAVYDGNHVAKAIKHGTPLPKHHGRIIDESQIRHIMCHTEQELYGNKIRYIKTTDAPTIIERSDADEDSN